VAEGIVTPPPQLEHPPGVVPVEPVPVPVEPPPRAEHVVGPGEPVVMPIAVVVEEPDAPPVIVDDPAVIKIVEAPPVVVEVAEGELGGVPVTVVSGLLGTVAGGVAPLSVTVE
jgi:hypothetical protein